MLFQHPPSVHFIGICGKAMGPIAAALSRAGWAVTGSDEGHYPPICDYLVECGIPVTPPTNDENAMPEHVDFFVVGNRVTKGNPELSRALSSGKKVMSFPGFLHDFFLSEGRNAVVSGGAGKTTTTAMLAWILEHAGLHPDYLIGGMPANLPHPARFMGSGLCVLEGDEYASCFNDLRPKFMHYEPTVAVVTNLIEDHPDLFADSEALFRVFAEWVESFPSDGCLVLPDHDPAALRLASFAPGRVETIGFGAEASTRITQVDLLPGRSLFLLGTQAFDLPMCGRMNIQNAAMAVVAADHLGVPRKVSAHALGQFGGVGNRQQSIATDTCHVIFDKASHPASLRELFLAARQQYPGKRIVSAIQPRGTGGKEWIYQRQLPDSLSLVDAVILAPPYEHKPRPGQFWPGGPFSTDSLVAELQSRGIRVVKVRDAMEIGSAILRLAQPDDVVVVSLPEQRREASRAILETLAKD